MKALMTMTLLAAGLHLSVAANASDRNGDRCSTSMLAGRWLFATGIGHQALGGNAPPPADITALGTMNIRRNGDVEGVFDVTFEAAAFRPSVPYTGTMLINADCTGTLSFVTGAGTMRTDSIAVLNRHELWGMSQDPKSLWTYHVRRLPGSIGKD